MKGHHGVNELTGTAWQNKNGPQFVDLSDYYGPMGTSEEFAA